MEPWSGGVMWRGEDGEHQHLLLPDGVFFRHSSTPVLQYSSAPILRLNGVADADERVDVTEKHPLAASERIP
jgi:hypothetical protein